MGGKGKEGGRSIAAKKKNTTKMNEVPFPFGRYTPPQSLPLFVRLSTNLRCFLPSTPSFGKAMRYSGSKRAVSFFFKKEKKHVRLLVALQKIN